jgi:hypothetical protein
MTTGSSDWQLTITIDIADTHFPAADLSSFLPCWAGRAGTVIAIEPLEHRALMGPESAALAGPDRRAGRVRR